jgi:hypothetical protein
MHNNVLCRQQVEHKINFQNMKTRTLIIILTLIIGLFVACTDKKKTKEKMETEIISEEIRTPVEDYIDEDERRKLDSIRQVKEHGHAH